MIMDSDENVQNINNEFTPRENDFTARSNDYGNDDNNFVKNVYIHRNGDMFSSSRRFVYNKKQLRTWDAFLEDLTSTLNPRTGPIRSIHTPQTGTKVQTYNEIQPNSNYVALATGEKLQMIGYLKLIQEQEAAKKRRNYHLPSQGASEASSVPSSVQRRLQVSGRIKYEMQKRGKTIYIFRNGDEYTRAICVLLKYFDMKSMDLVLKVVGEKVILPTSLPIRKLLTMDGEVIVDTDQLEDNKPYVASGYEPFVPCSYGQTLPNIICGPKKQERIRYLNSVTTPPPGKQRNKNNINSNDLITPKHKKQIISNDKQNNTARTENGLQKTNPKIRPTSDKSFKSKDRDYIEENREEYERNNNYENNNFADNDEQNYFEKELKEEDNNLSSDIPIESDVDENNELYQLSAHIIQTGYRTFKQRKKNSVE